jgi:uncharacterized damage-inducible protein DinB
MIVTPPEASEIPDFFKAYVGHITPTDAVVALQRQESDIRALANVATASADLRYAAGKWSVKEVVGHMIDAERIFIYRLLRIGRGDRTPLPPFDENAYVMSANAAERTMADLSDEMASVRASAIALVKSLSDRALASVGTVRAGEISARAQVFVIAGHFEHHLRILRDRYGVDLNT